MGYDVHASGWAKYFLGVQDKHGKILAVSDTMRLMAEDAYYGEMLGNEDERDLLAFLVGLYSQKLNHRPSAVRKRQEAEIRQTLKRNRILVNTRQRMPGAKAIRVEKAIELEIDASSDE